MIQCYQLLGQSERGGIDVLSGRNARIIQIKALAKAKNIHLSNPVQRTEYSSARNTTRKSLFQSAPGAWSTSQR
jgi:hypothetical protein